jgi:3-demethylubiquinone-9 3-methyltransferase
MSSPRPAGLDDSVTHYTEAGPREAGMVMTVEFELDGQRFVGINGGPEFTFDEAVSLQINCEGEEEVDYCWELLGPRPRAGAARHGGDAANAQARRRRAAGGGRWRHGVLTRRLSAGIVRWVIGPIASA